MQRIFTGLFALLILATCGTPKTTTDVTTVDPAPTTPAGQVFRTTPPEPGPAPTIELGDFQDFTLDNGLRVILVENHKLPRVSYQLFVDVPPQLEGRYAGAADMLGDMLRRATATKSKEEIDEAVDFIGAQLSTSGSGASAFAISKYKEDILALMAEVVLDARFPAQEFDKVKSEAEAGLKASLGNPGAVARRVRDVVVYGPGHPYGELVTEETLDNIALEQVKNYYETYFAPNVSYLVMVGDLTRPEAEEMAKEHFGDWEKRDVPQPTFETPDRPDGVTVNFVPRSGAVQSNILISHPVEIKPGTEMALEGSMLNNVLGASFSGRLFQNLREDKAYTYGANSTLRPDPYAGSFSAFADVRSEVTDSAVTEFMKELKMISSDEVTPVELARTKAAITGSFGRALENPARIANYALNTVRYGLDRDYYPTYLQKVAEVDGEDLLATAGKVITPGQTHIIVVGDKAVAEKLARFSTTGEVNYYDANGKLIDMADMAAPTNMTAESVLKKYVDAIGGQEAIDQIERFSMTMGGEVQGQKMSQTVHKDGGNKMSSQMTMMGMTMADQRYNDGKAKVIMQGNPVPPNPAVDAALKEEAVLFPVANLLKDLDRVTVSGTETIDGKQTVVLDATNESGTSQHYFDTETGLQVRYVKSQGPQRITFDLSDYREVEGVKFPFTMSMSGLAPFPIEMNVTEAKVNEPIDETLFSVED